MSLTGPSAVRSVVGLSLIVHSAGLGSGLLTLRIVGSSDASSGLEVRDGHCLRGTTVAAATTGISLGRLAHCSLGVTSNVVRSIGRGRMADVVAKLRHGTGVASSCFKVLTKGLLGKLGYRVVVSGFLVPIGAVGQVIVTIPPGTRCRSNFPH